MAITFGFSMGGAAAIRCMARHDELGTSKLILLGAAAPRVTKGPDFPYSLEKENATELIEQAKVDTDFSTINQKD